MKTKIVSLDIETVFDTEAQAKLPAFAVIKRRHGRWPLHRIAAASLIIVERAHSSGQPVIRSLGLHLGMANERDMLQMIEANMPRPDNDDEDLVTFNGAAHDLPILRQRALALGLFEIPKIAGCDLLPRNHAIGKLARQMETSDAARPIYRGSDHWRAARA